MTQDTEVMVPRWTLADRLIKSRDHAQITQQEMADHLGLHRHSVARYESGVIKPKTVVLRSWADRCGVPLEWLVGDLPTYGYNPICPELARLVRCA